MHLKAFKTDSRISRNVRTSYTILEGLVSKSKSLRATRSLRVKSNIAPAPSRSSFNWGRDVPFSHGLGWMGTNLGLLIVGLIDCWVGKIRMAEDGLGLRLFSRGIATLPLSFTPMAHSSSSWGSPGLAVRPFVIVSSPPPPPLPLPLLLPPLLFPCFRFERVQFDFFAGFTFNSKLK